MVSGNTGGSPVPSTLEAVDHVPKGVQPAPMRITYSSDSVEDYINLDRSGWGVTLELAGPVFNIVHKIGEVTDKVKEVREALAAFDIANILTHFTSTVAEYVNALLSVPALPEVTGLGTAVYLLTKLYDAGLLTLKYIHQASIDELPNWIGLVEEAKDNPAIDVS